MSRKPSCIDLQKHFGDRYKIAFDPVYSPFNVPKHKLDRWMMVLPCKFGDISPHGDEELQWYCEGHCKIRPKVKRLDCTKVFTEGDNDICCLFDIAYFDQVAEVIRPKKLRQYTSEQKQEMVEHLREHQFPCRGKSLRTRPQNASEHPTRL